MNVERMNEHKKDEPKPSEGNYSDTFNPSLVTFKLQLSYFLRPLSYFFGGV